MICRVKFLSLSRSRISHSGRHLLENHSEFLVDRHDLSYVMSHVWRHIISVVTFSHCNTYCNTHCNTRCNTRCNTCCNTHCNAHCNTRCNTWEARLGALFYLCTHNLQRLYIYIHHWWFSIYVYRYIHIYIWMYFCMWWLRLVGSIKL